MRTITPQSEDFLYWDPEDICNYPLKQGPEDNWIEKSFHEQFENNLQNDKEAENE